MLGISDAFSMSRSFHRPSEPAHYIEDCGILRKRAEGLQLKALFIKVYVRMLFLAYCQFHTSFSKITNTKTKILLILVSIQNYMSVYMQKGINRILDDI